MYKKFQSKQDKMDGQQGPTYRSPNAEGGAVKYGATFDKEIDWFTRVLNAVHSELKDDSPVEVPHSIDFPNHAQLSEQQKDQLMTLYLTACTMKSKAHAYNANRTKGNASQTNGNSDKVVEVGKLTVFVRKLHEAMVDEVNKWPNEVPYPQDASPLHTIYYEAIQGLYMKAKTVALYCEKENSKQAAQIIQLNDLLKQRDNELKEVKQRNSERMSTVVNKYTNQAANTRELDELLKQLDNEFKEVKQRDSEGIGARENENPNNATIIGYLNQNERQLNEVIQRDSKEMSAKMRELEERLKQREQELREVKHRDSEGMSDKKIRELDERLKQREHELRELKQSALMGAKLQDGNVNLADLSDTNRPTKIAERFGQLYDDYWTDAFQIMTGNFGRSDEEAIARLLEMLKDAYQFCKRTSQEQTNGVLRELRLHEKSNTQRPKQKPQIKDLNEVQREQLHELRRLTANCTTGNLTIMYFDHATTAGKFGQVEIKECTPYLELGIELCWYMIIQNPPIHVQFEPPMRGKPFKTGEYKFYSRSGKTFNYVVWPPLRLTEGGDLLAKGVAEPMR